MNIIIEVVDRYVVSVKTDHGNAQVTFADPLTRAAVLLDLGRHDQAIPLLSDLHQAIGEYLAGADR